MADAVAPVNSEAPLRPVNPATGQVVGEVPCSTEPDVSASVKRARKAQPAWGATTPARRAAALRRAGEAVAAHADELAALVTAEMGKPRGAALAEALDVSHRLRGVEPLLPALEPKEHRAGAVVTRVLRDPLGVVAVITPWNFPLTLAEMLISPAILAGNSVVFKPSELSPLSGSRLHGLLAGGLPPGVLELVQGRSDVGRALVASDVQMIAFVGSLVVGKAIMREAARNLKRLVLELGGNDAMLVLEDADVEASADFAVQCGFRNAGQVCVSVGRVYVHEAIAEDFVEAVVQRTRSLRVGSGEGDDVQVGPLASAAQLQRILSRLEEARQRGARVIVGGRAIPGPGFFLEPAVGRWVEETFGPVLTDVRLTWVHGLVEHAREEARRMVGPGHARSNLVLIATRQSTRRRVLSPRCTPVKACGSPTTAPTAWEPRFGRAIYALPSRSRHGSKSEWWASTAPLTA